MDDLIVLLKNIDENEKNISALKLKKEQGQSYCEKLEKRSKLLNLSEKIDSL